MMRPGASLPRARPVVLLLCAALLALSTQSFAQNHAVGSEYFVRASNWHESLRLSMEKVKNTAPPPTAPAVTTPLTVTDKSTGTASAYSISVNVTGWTDLWLVNDYDQSATGAYYVPSWDRSGDTLDWYGVWGNPRLLDQSGNLIQYTLEDGFCSAYQNDDTDCNVNLFGKGDRYQVKIGSTVFPYGLNFGGNAAWHVYLSPTVRSSMRTFKATVGCALIQTQPEMKFRVIQHPDFKVWLREMWARTLIAFPADFAEITVERSVGSIWDSQWGSVNELARRYAAAITYNKANIKNAAVAFAASATTVDQLWKTRSYFYVARKIDSLGALFRNFTESSSFIDWFSSVESKEVQVKRMISVYGAEYKEGSNHLAMLNEMKRLRSIAFQTFTATTDPSTVYQAADDLYDLVNKFFLSFPPWLYTDMNPRALRNVTVSTTADLKTAITNAKIGDHIILKNGFYPNTGNLIPANWPPNPTSPASQDPTYPLVIRAENPGGAVVTGSSELNGRYFPNVVVRGIVFRHSLDFALRFRNHVRNVRFTDCVMTGTREGSSITWNSPNIRLDHNYYSSALEDHTRGYVIDGPGDLGFGINEVSWNFVGYRQRLFANGGEFLQNYGPIHFYSNMIHRYIGEGAEIVKCAATGCKMVNNTMPREQVAGQLPGRLGSHGHVIGNYWLNNGARVGGQVDKMSYGNYIENGNLEIGSQAFPSSFYSDQIHANNTIIGGGIESDTYYNPRAQFKIAISDNVFINLKRWDNTPDLQTSVYSGNGNLYTPNAVPSYLASSQIKFITPAPPLSSFYRDEWGIFRPIKPLGRGFSRPDAPFHAFDTRIGPSYAPVSVRINRKLASEWSFSTARNPASFTVHSDWGTYAWHLDMFHPNGTRASRRSASGAGLPGFGGDLFAFSNLESSMGGAAGVARGVGANMQNWNAFTLAGWFKASSVIGNNAVIFTMANPSSASTTAVELSAPSAGTLQLKLSDSSVSTTATSTTGIYSQVNSWVFFAVSFNPNRGQSKAVQFWRGSADERVTLVSTVGLSTAINNLRTQSCNQITIGAKPTLTNGFAGLLDNLRLWVSDNGPDRVDTVTDNAADVSQTELQNLLWSDLGSFTSSDPQSEKSPTRAKATGVDQYAILAWTFNTAAGPVDVLPSSFAHNGVVSGSVRSGILDPNGYRVATFSGGSYIWHREHIDIDMQSFASRTISLRFAVAKASTGRKVLYREGTSERGMNLYLLNNTIYAGVWDISSGISQHSSFVSYPVPAAQRLDWTSVTMVIDSSSVKPPAIAPNGLVLYINGTRVASKPAARIYKHNAAQGAFSLGNVRGSTRFHDIGPFTDTTQVVYFEGSIDELRMWNRALSPADISLGNNATIEDPSNDAPVDPPVSDIAPVDTTEVVSSAAHLQPGIIALAAGLVAPCALALLI